MSNRTDKNILKQYFRSGSRPTQKQFHELIDNCYNDVVSSSVSGYQVMTDVEGGKTITSLKREAGKTYLIPYFERINLLHRRVYHYSIPCNVGSSHVLDLISMDISLPKDSSYKVRDGRKEVGIKQTISIESISIYNGGHQLHSVTSGIKIDKSPFEINIQKKVAEWFGIGVDVALLYDIKSDIAVSDQLDIGAESQNMLLHTFGSVSCNFTVEE
jgi:hypothetical protein